MPYGWSREVIQGFGLYFNQRLFEEAGLDPQLPFDLQMAGEWTWDAFMEIAHQLTRDIDNDGIMDTWAIATFSSDTLVAVLGSNNAKFVGRDATGRFTNETTTPEFLESLAFMQSWYELGIMMPQPEGSEWNWFDQAFLNAQVAMRVGGAHLASGLNDNLADPFGFVVFPVGPNATQHHRIHHANIFMVPSTFSPEEVDDIMFAYQLWNRFLPEWDDPEGWMIARYLVHPDPRSVEETEALFLRNPEMFEMALQEFIPVLARNTGVNPAFSWRLWQEESDPSVIVEEAQQRMEDGLAIANANWVAPDVCPTCGRPME
jgi:ABC-type glycerol-3-phosphate transport system substrate-binding protein